MEKNYNYNYRDIILEKNCTLQYCYCTSLSTVRRHFYGQAYFNAITVSLRPVRLFIMQTTSVQRSC